ncbi:hypothetical protein SAMN06296036_12635 [Pseudobacteriovorax antillogorgiicola]|uniref:Lipoprotein n=2 Tax=Pseudobacteriovorax antillogorgiicola TaxID=1513793 RepID=A0A1Y6CKA9_9BACT|nr:hypothetical protein EDD56_12663 [Pseudobacteriovorax antillogorgiicola]SMF71129.1 hypothetical protein SAMN06296036_12635 [Pseudobacteriovorax antillogorgiicola]
MIRTLNLVVIASFWAACTTHRYYPSTYDSALDHFIPKEGRLAGQSFLLSCLKRENRQVSPDEPMCDHLSTLLEDQGARVLFAEDLDNGGVKPNQPLADLVELRAVSELKWYEASNLGWLLNVASYGCYPYDKQRWYEAEITVSLNDRIVDQRTFKSHWVETRSWCIYLYSETANWLADAKNTADYKKANTQHFDTFVSQLAYTAARQGKWEKGSEESP